MATLSFDPNPRTGEVVAALRRHLGTDDLRVRHGALGSRTTVATAVAADELCEAAALYLDPLGIDWLVDQAAA